MDKNAQKLRNQDVNPCLEETDASQKCLDAYKYDKNMCSAYFQRYRNCRKYWAAETLILDATLATPTGWSQCYPIEGQKQHNVMVQRRRDGVKPNMPTAAERQEILAAVGGKPY